MKIDRLHVQNFRCIRDATLECSSLTALVGPNGSGKSTYLRALELFASQTISLTREDFYNGCDSEPISISITFSELSPAAMELFARYIQNGRLVVTRTLTLHDNKTIAKYYGIRRQVQEFAEVRRAPNATAARELYATIRSNPKFSELPTWRSREQVDTSMSLWEDQHSNECEDIREENQFFGFAEVAQGYLGQFIRFIFIPAVRDAEIDATEGKGSPISELMDTVVRKALAEREDVQSFWSMTQEGYTNLMDVERVPELERLRASLDQSLRSYLPSASLLMNWSVLPKIELPLPRAEIKIEEDGYAAPVAKTGHGTQRAFILSVLQQLATMRANTSTGESANNGIMGPSLALIIEEPELYQHPNRQRMFAKTLVSLAEHGIPEFTQSVQVFYGTHCPHFVSVDRFPNIRVLQKVPQGPGEPRASEVRQADGNAVARKLYQALQACGNRVTAPEFTWQTLRPRLQTVMTPDVNEGFFADIVVLVEGALDKAALTSTANILEMPFEDMGVTVIECGGKASLDRPLLIFREFGIPVYTVWDGDKGNDRASPAQNRLLLQLHNSSVENWPSTRVEDDHACFETTLEATLKEELSIDVYDEACRRCAQDFFISSADGGIKHIAFVEALFNYAGGQSALPATLKEIVLRVAAMSASLDQELAAE